MAGEFPLNYAQDHERADAHRMCKRFISGLLGDSGVRRFQVLGLAPVEAVKRFTVWLGEKGNHGGDMKKFLEHCEQRKLLEVIQTPSKFH